MLSFDGGHYFFSGLIPVRTRPTKGEDLTTSPIHALRETLATLPTARQNAATLDSLLNSPFARCDRTHFTRLVVMDDPAFNGRQGQDAILAAIEKTNLLEPQSVDHFKNPYIFWAIDFDAPDGRPQSRDAYFIRLWGLMAEELTTIFQYAVGFEQVRSGMDFARYMARCELETTMPFTDYWITSPPLPSLDTNLLLALAIVPALIGLGLGTYFCLPLVGGSWAGIWNHLTHLDLTGTDGAQLLTSLLAGLGTGLLGLLIGAFVAYLWVMAAGRKPFPMAPNSDLQSVLKALYLQAAFSELTIAVQGADDQTLSARFSAFLRLHQPLDPLQPRLEPGNLLPDLKTDGQS